MSSRNRHNPSRQQLGAEIEALRAVNERPQAQVEERERAHEGLRAQEQTVRERENELRLVVNTVPVLIA